MARVRRGSIVDFEGTDTNSVAMIANASIVPCNVEKVFSYLKKGQIDRGAPQGHAHSAVELKDFGVNLMFR